MSNNQVAVYTKDDDGKIILKWVNKSDVVEVLQTDEYGRRYVHFRLIRNDPIPSTRHNEYNGPVTAPSPPQDGGKKRLSKKTSKTTSSKPKSKTAKPKTTKPKK